MWIVCLIFEQSGGRANQIGVPIENLPIKAVLKNFKNVLFNRVNIYFITICICIITTGLVCLFKNRKLYSINVTKILSICSFCIFITSIYLTLLCSKTYTSYANRADCEFCVIFFCFIFVLVLLSVCIKTDKVKFFIPIIIFILLTQLINDKSYRRFYNCSPEAMISVDNYMISQIKEAALKNQKELDMIVPKGINERNSPHGAWIRDMGRTLYVHGITDKIVRVRIKPDVEVNKKFNLPY